VLSVPAFYRLHVVLREKCRSVARRSAEVAHLLLATFLPPPLRYVVLSRCFLTCLQRPPAFEYVIRFAV
jgi:hypothetical protein